MDLTVNNRLIAMVDPRPIQLGRLLGAFELTIPFSGTVHAVVDGIYRSLTIAGARISMRGKNGQVSALGRAVPDNTVVIRQYENSARADFALRLTLQPHQLELLECERDGADLHLTVVLLARATSSDQTGADWEQYVGEAQIIVPRSLWIEQLNQSTASRILFLEIRLPDGEIRHPAERHLRRAQEMLTAGDWRSCISECRQFAEELGEGKLAPAMNMLQSDRRSMTKQHREDLLLAALHHYGHLAAHSESQRGELGFERADAKMAVSLAASLAEHHFGRA
ncbi:hypothetical protein [Acidocella sp.]|uniref:hypothetical protein n=1 Tax=Acidocella sp. TaxID=50710 RepID=UPI003CFC61B8